MIGRTISHYQILDKLGEGGMGVVYKAKDTHLDRFVAIKVLPPERVADPERKRRFVQEAKAASALNHPNIVTVHDIDQAEGVDFIAMEYVEGKTLHELIQGRGLPLSQCLDYSAQIASAISKAHAAGIVHRDLKPSNVMITGEGLVKVLDFGLAKLTGRAADGVEEEDDTWTLTQTTEEGVVLGTLAYMSPEQARGQPLDHRTDIFSLGVALYQMVSGALPFRGPNAVETLDKLLHAPTPSLKAAYPDLPDELERTVVRATAKDRDERYQSMQEMGSDLRALIGAPRPAATVGIDSEPTATAVGTVRQKKPRAAKWSAIVLAALLVLLAALLFRDHLPRWLGGTPLPAQIRLAVLPFTNVTASPEDQLLCDGLTDVLATKLGRVERFQDALRVVAASEVRSSKVATAVQANGVFHVDRVLSGSVRRAGGRILLTLSLVDTKNLRQIGSNTCDRREGELIGLENDAFSRAVAMLKLDLKTAARQALSAGQTKDAAAYDSYLRAAGYFARYDVPEPKKEVEAERKKDVDSAIRLFEEATRRDSQFALAYAGLGEACWRKYQDTRQRQWADLALQRCLRSAELDKSLSRVHVTLGMVYRGIGERDKAMVELNRAVSMDPRSAEGYRELGRAYGALDQAEKAENAYRKAIQLRPDCWSCHWYLGVFLLNRARYSHAAEEFREVIRLVPDHFLAYSALGGVYIYEWNYDQAAAMFEKSLSIRPTPEAYSNFGALRILQGRDSEAVPLLEQATAGGTSTYKVWGNLGDAYAHTLELSGHAGPAYARAAELVREQLKTNESPGARASLASYLIGLGNKRQALAEIERALTLAPEDAEVLFRAALVFEAAGNRGRALKTLAAAAAKGYSLALIRSASDLAALRKDPGFREVIESQKAH
jgi:tetratricopeptide (TPR) repeat protein/predicted Ser/Thr protein kinase